MLVVIPQPGHGIPTSTREAQKVMGTPASRLRRANVNTTTNTTGARAACQTVVRLGLGSVSTQRAVIAGNDTLGWLWWGPVTRQLQKRAIESTRLRPTRPLEERAHDLVQRRWIAGTMECAVVVKPLRSANPGTPEAPGIPRTVLPALARLFEIDREPTQLCIGPLANDDEVCDAALERRRSAVATTLRQPRSALLPRSPA